MSAEYDLLSFLKKTTVLPMGECLMELAKGGILVTGPLTDPMYFADNLIRKCGVCDQDVQTRPYNDVATKIVCTDCIVQLLKGDPS